MDWLEKGMQEAKDVRARLERASPSGARRNIVNILNSLATESASQELPGLAALEGIRKAQRLGYRTAADHNRAHAKFEKTEAFNRLHPAGRAR